MSGSEANYGATDEEESVTRRRRPSPPLFARQDSNCSSSSIEAGSTGSSDLGSMMTPSVRSLKVGGRFGSIHSLSGFGGSFVAGDGQEDLEEEDLESGLGRRRSQDNESFSDLARRRSAMRRRRGRNGEEGLSIAFSVSSTISSISVSAKGNDRLSNADTLLEKVGEDKQERQCAPHVFVWGDPRSFVCHIVRVVQRIYQTGKLLDFTGVGRSYFTIRCVLIRCRSLSIRSEEKRLQRLARVERV